MLILRLYFGFKLLNFFVNLEDVIGVVFFNFFKDIFKIFGLLFEYVASVSFKLVEIDKERGELFFIFLNFSKLFMRFLDFLVDFLQ